MKKIVAIFLFLPLMTWASPTQFNFDRLESIDNSKGYLACPENYCNDKKKLVTPVFNMSRAKLEEKWQMVAATLPRTQLISQNEKTDEYVYTQRSMMLHFPDDIFIKFVDLGENKSGILMYSQSRYGHYDFGINKARVKDWLKLLQSQAD